jgi:hypothetical protein
MRSGASVTFLRESRVELREGFIIGPPRSGTTLMAFLLGGGAGVLCLSEPFLQYSIAPHWKLNRFFYRFEKSAGLARTRPPQKGDNRRYGAFLRRLARMNGFRYLAIKETFRHERPERCWCNAEFLDGLATDGTPMVTLIRHPYDIAASTIKLCRWVTGLRGWMLRCRWPFLPHFRNHTGIVRWAVRNWVSYLDWARRHGLELVRYEDVVAAPETHVPAICERLGLPFERRMLDYRQPRIAFGGIGDPWLMHRPPRPVSTQSVGQAHKLTREQREVVRAACAGRAPELDYTL